MQSGKAILIISMTATADVTARRFVGLTGAHCAVGAKAAGVANADYAAGEQVGVEALGLLMVTAGAAISAGVEVQSDANGLAITKSTGVGNGYALTAATQAGDQIRILRGI